MKKIIAIILTVLTIFSLTACGGKDTKGNSAVDELDKMVKDELGDMVIGTNYEDDVYYIFVQMDGISSTYAITYSGLDDSFDGLSETIYELTEIENAICVVSDMDCEEILYVSYNGNDITDYMQ